MILESKACNSEIRNRTRKTDTKNVRPGVVEKSRPKNEARKNETRKVKPVKRARRS